MPIPDLLAGVFGSLPEDLRAQVTTVLDDPQAAPVVAELVNGYKRQADYSRAMDDARAADARAKQLYESNQAWYAANSAALEAAKAARGQTPAPVTPATPTPGTPAPNFTLDQVNDLVQRELSAFSGDALGVMAQTQDLAFRHFQEFGERLALPEIIQAAQAGKMTLAQAYDQKFADRYAAKATKADEDRIAKIRAEAEAAVRAEYAQHPYPVRPGQGVDTLSGLTADPAKAAADYSVAAAVAEYAQYEAKRALA